MLFEFGDNYVCNRVVNPKTCKIIFARGLPRSGKTSIAKRYIENHNFFTPGFVLICGDDFRLATHGQTYNRLAEPHVSQSVLTAIRALIIGGYQVLFDETNSSEWSLRRIFEIDKNAAYFEIQTPKSTCLENNFRSGKNIPEEVFHQVERNLLTIDPEIIRKDYL